MMALINLNSFGAPAKSALGRSNRHVGEWLFDEYLTVLRSSWGQDDGQWRGVTRKLELFVDHFRDTDIGDPRPVVEAMHAAFMGELWIDRRLCYRDGREVMRPFEYDKCMVKWQTAWFLEELTEWRNARRTDLRIRFTSEQPFRPTAMKSSFGAHCKLYGNAWGVSIYSTTPYDPRATFL